MILVNGAEARVSKDNNTLIKERVAKTYRHPALDDRLRKARSRKEKKLLEKAREYVRTPKVLFGDDTTIVMEFIAGEQVKEVLEQKIFLAKEIGSGLGLLHKNNIIHGDLTTSNVLVDDKGIVFIDFGLGFVSKKDEDKAVDIHVFKESLESKHHLVAKKAFEEFLMGYTSTNPKHKSVFDRLQAVESRGRNKNKQGS